MAGSLRDWLGPVIEQQIASFIRIYNQEKDFELQKGSQPHRTQNEFEFSTHNGVKLKIPNIIGSGNWLQVVEWENRHKPACYLADSSTCIFASFEEPTLEVLCDDDAGSREGTLIDITTFDIAINLEEEEPIELIIKRCEVGSTAMVMSIAKCPAQQREETEKLLSRLRSIGAGKTITSRPMAASGENGAGRTSFLPVPETAKQGVNLHQPVEQSSTQGQKSGPPAAQTVDTNVKLLRLLGANPKPAINNTAATTALDPYKFFRPRPPGPVQAVGNDQEAPVAITSPEVETQESAGQTDRGSQVHTEPVDSSSYFMLRALTDRSDTQGTSAAMLTQFPPPGIGLSLSTQSSEVLSQGPAQPAEQPHVKQPIVAQPESSVERATVPRENDKIKENLEFEVPSVLSIQERPAAAVRTDLVSEVPAPERQIQRGTTHCNSTIYSPAGQRRPRPLYLKYARRPIPEDQMNILQKDESWRDERTKTPGLVPAHSTRARDKASVTDKTTSLAEVLDKTKILAEVHDSTRDFAVYKAGSQVDVPNISHNSIAEVNIAPQSTDVTNGTGTPESESDQLSWDASPESHFEPQYRRTEKDMPPDSPSPVAKAKYAKVSARTETHDSGDDDMIDGEIRSRDDRNATLMSDPAAVSAKVIGERQGKNELQSGPGKTIEVAADQASHEGEGKKQGGAVSADLDLDEDGDVSMGQPRAEARQNPGRDSDKSAKAPDEWLGWLIESSDRSNHRHESEPISELAVDTRRKSVETDMPVTFATTPSRAPNLPLSSSSRYSGSQMKHGMFKTSTAPGSTPSHHSRAAAAPLTSASGAGIPADALHPRIEVAETPRIPSAVQHPETQKMKRTLSPQQQQRESKRRQHSRFGFSSDESADEDPRIKFARKKREYFRAAPKKTLVGKSSDTHASHRERSAAEVPRSEPQRTFIDLTQDTELPEQARIAEQVSKTNKSVNTAAKSSEPAATNHVPRSRVSNIAPHPERAPMIAKEATANLDSSKGEVRHAPRGSLATQANPIPEPMERRPSRRQQYLPAEHAARPSAVSRSSPQKPRHTVPYIPPERQDEINVLAEPGRAKEWIGELFLRDRFGEVSQADLYKYYKHAFGSNKTNKVMVARDLLNCLSEAFHTVDFSRTDEDKAANRFLIRGIRLKQPLADYGVHAPKGTDAPVSSGQKAALPLTGDLLTNNTRAELAQRTEPGNTRGGRATSEPRRGNVFSTRPSRGDYRSTPTRTGQAPGARRSAPTLPDNTPTGPRNVSNNRGGHRGGWGRGRGIVGSETGHTGNPAMRGRHSYPKSVRQPSTADSTRKTADDEDDKDSVTTRLLGRVEEFRPEEARSKGQSQTRRADMSTFLSVYSKLGKSGGNAFAVASAKDTEVDESNGSGWAERDAMRMDQIAGVQRVEVLAWSLLGKKRIVRERGETMPVNVRL